MHVNGIKSHGPLCEVEARAPHRSNHSWQRMIGVKDQHEPRDATFGECFKCDRCPVKSTLGHRINVVVDHHRQWPVQHRAPLHHGRLL